MKPLTIGLLLVVANCGPAFSQTSPVVSRAWLSLPASRLLPIACVSRVAVGEFESSGEFSEVNNSQAVLDYRQDLQDEIVLNRHAGEFDYRTYRLVHDRDFLKRPEPLLDDLFSRTLNGIFLPEPFRIGKTTVSCSLVTAIKRKNPLCLLNPIVLNISW